MHCPHYVFIVRRATQTRCLSNAFDGVVDCELRWRSFLLIAECAKVRHITARASKVIARNMIKLSLTRCPDCDADVVFCVQGMRSFAELRDVQYINVLCICK